MLLNYVLMAVSFVYAVFAILRCINGRRGYLFSAVLGGIVFVLAVVATAKGVSYNELRYWLESLGA